MRTIADDCAQVAESGLKPAFESAYLDFPQQFSNKLGSTSPQLQYSWKRSWRGCLKGLTGRRRMHEKALIRRFHEKAGHRENDPLPCSQ